MKKIILMGLLVALLVACSEQPKTKINSKKYNVITLSEPPSKITKFTNNVYYFEYTQGEFGVALSTFLEDNKDLEVASMASESSREGYGCTKGYFVIFREKK